MIPSNPVAQTLLPKDGTPVSKMTLEERIAVLESKTGGSRWSARLLLIPLIALISLLTINVRTLKQQFETSQDQSVEWAFWKVCHSEASPQTRADCFLTLVQAKNYEWRAAQLDDMEIAGLDLTARTVESATFRRGIFPNAFFINANMARTTLELCELPQARFEGVDLSAGVVFKSNLPKANFRGAVLRSTSFEQSRAPGAFFTQADMTDSFLAMADLTGADFTAAELNNANLEAAVLIDANVALADFAGANIQDADFTNCNWWRARGLSGQQMDLLMAQFAPNDSASESRKRDFALWLEAR